MEAGGTGVSGFVPSNTVEAKEKICGIANFFSEIWSKAVVHMI